MIKMKEMIKMVACHKFKLNEELRCKILRPFKGLYGKQYVVETVDKGEMFLPTLHDLNSQLADKPNGLCVKIKMTAQGHNGETKSLFKIEPMYREDFEKEQDERCEEKYLKFL